MNTPWEDETVEESPWWNYPIFSLFYFYELCSLIEGVSSKIKWVLCIFQLVSERAWFSMSTTMRLGVIMTDLQGLAWWSKRAARLTVFWYRYRRHLSYSSKIRRVSDHVSITGILIGKVPLNSERRECGGSVQAKKCISDVIRVFKSKPREIPPSTVFWPSWWLLRFKSKPLLSLCSPFLGLF